MRVLVAGGNGYLGAVLAPLQRVVRLQECDLPLEVEVVGTRLLSAGLVSETLSRQAGRYLLIPRAGLA